MTMGIWRMRECVRACMHLCREEGSLTLVSRDIPLYLVADSYSIYIYVLCISMIYTSDLDEVTVFH